MKLQTKKLIDFYLGGFLITVLKPITMLVGKVLRRNHDISPEGDIFFCKMQGGGSLVIALPSLIGLRRKFPCRRFVLVTTLSIAPFARTLDVFDQILCFDDRSLFRLIASFPRVLITCFKADTFIDLEVYSRLTGILTVCSLARNRIGFFLDVTFWRKGLYTHLLFFNRFTGVYFFYEQICIMLGGEYATRSESGKHLEKSLPIPKAEYSRMLAIGHGCSDTAKERKLSSKAWGTVLSARIDVNEFSCFVFLGSSSEHSEAEEIINLLRNDIRFSGITMNNLCGVLALPESIATLRSAKLYIGIDSSLLHYARVLGVSSVSLWGPVHPKQMLKPWDDISEVIEYSPIPCSPCIHVAEMPPCAGNNICMKLHYDNDTISRKDELIRDHAPWKIK